MGNFLTTLKRFFGDKNTVTILGIIVGIIVLYVGYSVRVNQAIKPVTIPYAKVKIDSKKMITEDMIGYVKVSSSVVANSPNLIKNASELIGKYVSFNLFKLINVSSKNLKSSLCIILLIDTHTSLLVVFKILFISSIVK